MRKTLSRARWLVLGAALGTAGVIAACHNGHHHGTFAPNQGVFLIVTPNPIQMRASAPSTTATVNVNLAVIPTALRAVSVTAISIIGDVNNVFSVSPTALPVSIAPGQSINVPLKFTPNSTQDQAATLEVRSDDPVSPLDVPLRGSIGGEFQVNQTTARDQSRASVAALPAAAPVNGAVAVIIFQDFSDVAAPANPEVRYTIGSVDSNGNPVEGVPEPKLAHNTDGVQYIGLKTDASDTRYAATTRYHPSNVTTAPRPVGVFMNTVDAPGTDFGGVLVLDQVLPGVPENPDQRIQECDIAVDTAGVGAPRFCTWRATTASASGSLTALPIGMLGRLVGRFGAKLTPIFALSSAPTATQMNARVEFNGTRYLVVWEDGGIISGRLFTREGTAVGSDFAISLGTGATTPRLTANRSSGDFLVVWQQGGISGAIVHNDGTTAGVQTLNTVGVATQALPAVGIDASGNFMVVWAGPAASGTAIFARKFDGALAPQGLEAQVNQVGGNLSEPDVTFIPSMAQWIVVWTGTDQDGKGIKGKFVP